jgi:GntR family transcriptional regulator
MAEYADVLEAVSRLASDLLQRSAVKLPAERELAARLSTSRTTVRRALQTLEDSGVIRRVKGRAGGAYLSGATIPPPDPELIEAPSVGRKLERTLNQVLGVPAMLRSQGFASGTRVMSLTLAEPSAEAAESLRLGDDESVVSLLRLRYADGDTLSLEHAFLSARRFVRLLEYELTGSLYDLLRDEFDCEMRSADEWIEAIVAPNHVAGLLGIEPGAPLIKLTRQSYDTSGNPVEFSYDLFRADRTRFRVHEDQY